MAKDLSQEMQTIRGEVKAITDLFDNLAARLTEFQKDLDAQEAILDVRAAGGLKNHKPPPIKLGKQTLSREAVGAVHRTLSTENSIDVRSIVLELDAQYDGGYIRNILKWLENEGYAYRERGWDYKGKKKVDHWTAEKRELVL